MLVMLQNVVFAGVFLAAMFLVGTLLLHIVGWKQTTFGAVAWGFIAVMGVFQLIAYPLFLAKASFTALLVSFSAVLLGLLAAGAYVCFRGKVWHSVLGEVRVVEDNLRQTPIPFFVLGVLVLLLLYCGVFYYNVASDDSFYLPRSMEVIEQNSLGVSHAFSWFGYEKNGFPDSTDASTLEFFKAYLSYLSRMHVAILCRNGLEIALMVISLCSVWTFIDAFTQDREHAFSIRLYAMIVWTTVILLDLKTNTNASWITHFLWQGKSMLPGMTFPMLFAGCRQIMQHIGSFKYREWLPVMLTLLAGVAVTIVGIFLMPILFFLIGLAYLLSTKFRNFKRIAPCAVVCVLPVVVMIALCYFSVATHNTHYFSMNNLEHTQSWLSEMTYSTNKYILVLYVICAVYILRKGSKVDRAMFIVMPAILLVTFLNPLLRTFVSTYITTQSVYWRLFWLIPTLLLPAYAIPSFLLRSQTPKQVQKQLVSACVAVSMLAAAEWGRNGMTGAKKVLFPIERICVSRDNPYRVRTDAVAVSEIILGDWEGEGRPMLLFYDAEYRLNEVRQYTQKIMLASAFRENQIVHHTDLIPGTDVRECDFYDVYETIEDGAYLHDMLTRLGVDYVSFCGEPACTDPEENGFTPLYQGELMTLWRVDA